MNCGPRCYQNVGSDTNIVTPRKPQYHTRKTPQGGSVMEKNDYLTDWEKEQELLAQHGQGYYANGGWV